MKLRVGDLVIPKRSATYRVRTIWEDRSRMPFEIKEIMERDLHDGRITYSIKLKGYSKWYRADMFIVSVAKCEYNSLKNL